MFGEFQRTTHQTKPQTTPGTTGPKASLPATLLMSVKLHCFHFGCASLPRPCCISEIRPALCCYIPAVRASVCMLLCLRLSPWTACWGGFSPGACRPPCALPLLGAHYRCPVAGEEDRRRRRTARRGCRCIAGELRCVSVENKLSLLSLLHRLSLLTPLCLVAPSAVAVRCQATAAQLLLKVIFPFCKFSL